MLSRSWSAGSGLCAALRWCGQRGWGRGSSETRRLAVWRPVVARRRSDRPVSSTNGRSSNTSAAAAEALADDVARGHRDQILVDADQTASDSDQTLSDVDQTSADGDQTGADRDQASADCDQVAADRDQAASDQDLAAGGDAAGHDVSQGIRARTATARERTARGRDQSAKARVQAAEQRDAIADARDVAALARDQAAAARDLAIAQASRADERADGERALTGADIVLRAADQRRRAAQQRAKAAEHRLLAAEDRLIAERDREEAARERRRSLVDREMFVVELQRERALRDEALGHQRRAEQLARTLQRSLSPPSLPTICGLDVAVHYEPSAPEEVGGDFYDLFPLAAGRSGFFLGGDCLATEQKCGGSVSGSPRPSSSQNHGVVAHSCCEVWRAARVARLAPCHAVDHLG